MTTITFDTLAYVNQLKNANVPDEQAQAQAQALRQVLDTAVAGHAEELATRADLRSEVALLHKDIYATGQDLRKDMEMLRKEMEMLRKDIVIKIGAMFVVAIGILVSVIKLN